jgi:hypothetical protein
VSTASDLLRIPAPVGALEVVESGDSSMARVVRAGDGQVLCQNNQHIGGVFLLVWSPDGRLIA